MQIRASEAPPEVSPWLEDEIQTAIASTEDIVTARQRARSLATSLGFGTADLTLIAVAISEIARNIVDHAQDGEIVTRIVKTCARRGLQIVARDDGPGIPDVALVVEFGHATARRIGIGLPGVKWLMDEFDIVSAVGRGTTVTMTKWIPE